jgi:YD repeat-containing protein
MRYALRIPGFLALLFVLFTFAPRASAQCTVSAPTVSQEGTVLTISATGAGGNCGGAPRITLSADGFGEIGSEQCLTPAGKGASACTVTRTLDVACFLTGPLDIRASVRCYREYTDANGHHCDAQTTTSGATRVSINTTPTVSVTAEITDPVRNKGVLHVTYSFPNTTSPGDRLITLEGAGFGSLGSLQAPSTSGMWDPEFDFNCFETGPMDIIATAMACHHPAGDPLHSASAKTRVNVNSTPQVALRFKQGATGDSTIWVDYAFHNAGARAIDLAIDGIFVTSFPNADFPTLDATGSVSFPYDSSCKTGTFRVTAHARACGLNRPPYVGDADTTFTVNSKPSAGVSVGARNPNGSYPVTVAYGFPNTKAASQRRIELYHNGILTQVFTATDLPTASGSVTGTVGSCGEVLALAIACDRRTDEKFTATGVAQLPEDESCKHDRDDCEKPGRPVNYGSGDVSLKIPLFGIAQSPLDLTFGVAYHSLPPAYPSLARETGPGWTHSFNQTLRVIDGRHAYGLDESGRERFYTGVDDGTWYSTLPAEVHEELHRDGATLRLRDLSGTVRIFDAATGAWLSTTDRWGNSIRAGYDAVGNLTSVTDSVGRVITVTATGSTIQQLTLPNGATWRFVYGAGGNLISIFDPIHTGSTPWRTFEYQNDAQSHPRLLTAMRDDGGALLEGHTYDSAGRGITSFLENNRELLTL